MCGTRAAPHDERNCLRILYITKNHGRTVASRRRVRGKGAWMCTECRGACLQQWVGGEPGLPAFGVHHHAGGLHECALAHQACCTQVAVPMPSPHDFWLGRLLRGKQRPGRRLRRVSKGRSRLICLHARVLRGPPGKQRGRQVPPACQHDQRTVAI